MIKRLGLNQAWMDMIMRCVTTSKFVVKLNGGHSSCFVPSRGVRQDNLLSPYLFPFCVESFSDILKDAQQKNLIKGVSFGSTGPTIIHLLFADDSIVFLEGT